MNRITLYRTAAGWMAAHTGPYADQVYDAFGTRTLPTAFTAQAEAESVQAAIRALNPGFEVTVRP